MTSRQCSPLDTEGKRRRRLLSTLGLGAAAAYVAPTLFTLGQAQARGSGDFRFRTSGLSHFRASFTRPSFTRPSFSHPHHDDFHAHGQGRHRHRHGDDRFSYRRHFHRHDSW